MHIPDPMYSASRLVVMGGLLVLLSAVTGCGLLGSGDESEDNNFPEPPGRPSSSVQVMETPSVAVASPGAVGVSLPATFNSVIAK